MSGNIRKKSKWSLLAESDYFILNSDVDTNKKIILSGWAVCLLGIFSGYLFGKIGFLVGLIGLVILAIGLITLVIDIFKELIDDH